jgi:hypothetical protein
MTSVYREPDVGGGNGRCGIGKSKPDAKADANARLNGASNRPEGKLLECYCPLMNPPPHFREVPARNASNLMYFAATMKLSWS